jgi:uncharacterized membrane protein YfcA
VVGAKLLLVSDERLFLALVPWLILLGSGLVALQTPLRRWLSALSLPNGAAGLPPLACALVALAAVYGGYFGAGLSVILLGVLAITLQDSLTRLSGLKQLLALAANGGAALVFLASGRVAWPAAVALALGAVAGGLLGGRLASRVNGEVLRWPGIIAYPELRYGQAAKGADPFFRRGNCAPIFRPAHPIPSCGIALEGFDNPGHHPPVGEP